MRQKSMDEPDIKIPWELFSRTLDNCWELEAQWRWGKDEIRCGYKDRYDALVADIKELERIRDAWVGDGKD